MGRDALRLGARSAEDLEAWRGDAETGFACRLPAIDFPFGALGPGSIEAISAASAARELPKDRFGVRARASILFPPGDFVIRTVSDDGIRLRVDGEPLIDDWTWHASKTHEARLFLPEARSVELDVEYFELDGAAVLRVEIE